MIVELQLSFLLRLNENEKMKLQFLNETKNNYYFSFALKINKIN